MVYMIIMKSYDHLFLVSINYTLKYYELKVRKIPKMHWRSAFAEELGKFGKVSEVDSEYFYVRELAGILKVHKFSSEFFRVEAQ